ncbi:hypothetical protein [Loigolactobacillus backii]|nr:hypothetical protein [Loigolactobacillus backii]
MQTYQLILDVDDETKVLLVGTLPEVNEELHFLCERDYCDINDLSIIPAN